MIRLNKIGVQLVLWILLLGVHFLFTSHIVAFPNSLIFLANTTTFTAILFFGNIFYLFPKFSNPHKNSYFLIISILAVIILAIFYGYIDMLLFKAHKINLPEKFKYPFVPSFMKSLFWLMLVQMISTINLLQDDLRKRSEETKIVVEEKLNTELKFLKAQINPHFLFNALNNIYSLSYMKSEKGPDAILKLSGMLRYVLEDCQDNLVRLNSEIEYIANFIEFQQMKSPNLQEIDFNHTAANGSVSVAPMLFVPFIENSFKYSKIENTKNAFVNILIKTDAKSIEFEIKNSIPEKGKAKSGSGKGIANVKHRLQILYKNKHQIHIEEGNTEFEVKLKIDL